MKKIVTLLTVISALLILSNCGSRTNTDKSNTDSTVTTTQSTMENTVDFNTFFGSFKQKLAKNDYSEINYPFYYGAFPNATLNKGQINDEIKYLFEMMSTQADLEISDFSGDYIHEYLNENFMKTFGDLNGLKVVSMEPTPDGFNAYFKVINGNYKLIGIENIVGGM